MRVNIEHLNEILLQLKCKFADAIYSNYIKTLYAIKGCDSEVDLEETKEFINLLEEKIKLLEYNFAIIEKSCIIEPSRLKKISLEYFFEKDKFLTSCDRKILEKIL